MTEIRKLPLELTPAELERVAAGKYSLHRAYATRKVSVARRLKLREDKVR